MNLQEDNFVNDENVEKKFIKFSSNPKTSLDYANMQSEEYLTWKLKEKIKEKLRHISLADKYINEICELTLINYNKNKIRISDIIAIVTYKIIKKYDLNIPCNEFFKKINFDKSKYLKYSNDVRIGSIDEESYEDKIYNYIIYLTNKISEYFRSYPTTLKIDQKFLINSFFNNSEINSLEPDVSLTLQEVKKESRNYIYNNNFKQNFYNVITEGIGAGLIKLLLNSKGIKISLYNLSLISRISNSLISRTIKKLQHFKDLYIQV